MRRRLMMARKGGVKPASDGLVWAYFNVQDISEPTIITGISNTSYLSHISAYIDDVFYAQLPKSVSFETTGEHLVRYDISKATITNYLLSVPNIVRAYLPKNRFLGTYWTVNCVDLEFLSIDCESITVTSTNGCFEKQKLKTIAGLDKVLNFNGDNQLNLSDNPLFDFPGFHPDAVGRCPSFNGDKSLTITEIPEGITYIQIYGFRYCTAIPYLHFLNLTTPPQLGTNPFADTLFKLYVGDGTSQEADEAVKAIYLSDTGWGSRYSARLDTWYNYLHSND